MLNLSEIKPSPTRTYVAICNNTNFDGHYFRKFVLPQGHLEWGGKVYDQEGNETYCEGSFSRILENSPAAATWYFLNKLNFMACVLYAIPVEQFVLQDQDEMNEQSRIRTEKWLKEREEEKKIPGALYVSNP